jgi:hypothetical protein
LQLIRMSTVVQRSAFGVGSLTAHGPGAPFTHRDRKQ